MNDEEFDTKFEAGDLDELYAEYIMLSGNSERVICNGDTLTEAMEDQYLREEFQKSMTGK